MKKIIVCVCIFLCMFNFVYATQIEETSGETDSGDIAAERITADTFTFKTLKGEIIEAGEVYESDDGMNEVCQDVKVYINDKGYRATALTTYKMSFYADTTNHAKPLSAGDKVYVYTTFKDGKIVGSEISNRNNTKYIIIVIALFIITVVIVGGVKGIKSLIGLIFTIAAIFYLLIPGIMNGKDPLMLTILVSTLVIIVTLIIIAGFNRKSYAAMIGTVGGIIVSGLFAILFGNLMNMTGMCEETGLLVGLSDEAKAFDYRGILFSGIIIGALGACMDVGMSLASALQELKQEKPEINQKGLMKSGMNIGKDMIGTMTNTLILAYTGGALVTILIFSLGDLDLCEVLNKEILLEEIVRSIAGSIGLIFTIPITTLASGILLGSEKNKRRR